MHRITEKIGPWLNEAIDKHGQGENILWEHVVLPGSEGHAVFTVVVWFPSAVLGSVMQGSFQLHDPLAITEAEIDSIVAEFLRRVREARAQAAQEAVEQPQGPAGAPRGSRTASGLIVP